MTRWHRKQLLIQGHMQRDFGRGSQNHAGGLGNAMNPSAGSGAEPRNISKFMLFRGFEHLFPAWTFESHCCYSTIYVFFFTHKHQHRFQLMKLWLITRWVWQDSFNHRHADPRPENSWVDCLGTVCINKNVLLIVTVVLRNAAK